MNWARSSWESVGLRGSSCDAGGAQICALLASKLLGKESVFPTSPCTAPTRTPNTAIQTSLLFDGGSIDTVTAFAVHGVVVTETASQNQRVQSVHGYHIVKSLPTERPLVVGRGQTFRQILLQRQRPTEEQVEAINVLTLQKRLHHLLVDHTMNVRLARPSVGTSTQRWQRVDVALETSLHAQVALGVLWLLVVHLPNGLEVVERPWWRLAVDGHHPCWRRRTDKLGVLVGTSGHISVCRVQLMTRFLLSESFARE